MSLGKLIRITLNKEKVFISLYLCNLFCIMLFYYFIYDKHFIAYPILLSSFFLILYLSYKLYIYNCFYSSLEEAKTSPDYKVKDSVFEDIFEDIKEIHNSYISKIYTLENNRVEKEKLLTEWIHNMKTSVAVMNLAIDKLPNKDVISDIRYENSLLQKNLEGALNLFRLEEFSRDYVPEVINLKELVKKSINSQKRNFIYGDIFPDVRIPENHFILSDKKWSEYVLVQIISNAIKYSYTKGKVSFRSEETDKNIMLYIEDTGVGIKTEDLPRIFDVFFTGSNGRNEEKSSGIGLYMCKCICDNLGDKIQIVSEWNKGTSVKITYIKN
ncbi:sensor histidine kinase [Clostridium sp. SHJSY1]|uniref:sensor histidine kinase n=1 Tax=Clostridium sp. SHJSY1 TaxID=2942483 RepID=UPI002874B1FF|nr:sensor histidine kinase [Clostridium sp. SHJSY1]MDS0526000.1 sensor histidine kinase [Clostridium sp. SHJSY1]